MTKMMRIKVPPPNPASTEITSKLAITGSSPGSEVIVYEVGAIELLLGILAAVELVVILHSSIKSISVPGTVQLNLAV